MKRNILYIAMACMTLFASCKKEINQVLPEAVEMEFGATIDESDGGKTYLSGTSVLWADGDKISVNGTAIDLVAGAGYRYGTFRGKVTPHSTNKFYVGYPASATTFSAGTGTMTVGIPEEQNYSTDKPLSGVMPMAAYVEGTGNKMTIHFQNVANVLALKFYGAAGNASKVTRIEITSSVAALTGVVANIASDGTITPCAPTGDGKTITVDCGTGVQLGTDAAHATSIYVAIPKITTATTLTVRTYCANGCYQQNVINATESTFSGSNKIYPTRVKEVAAMNVPGALSGEFSVSATKKIRFSQGNLQYKPSTCKWRFAENQWNVCDQSSTSEHTTSNYTSSSTEWIDLFGWGTSGYSYGATYYQPYSTDNANASKYGPSSGNLSVSAKSDWGWNHISNGGNVANIGWRAFTTNGSDGDIDYILNSRPGDRYAKARVSGVAGLLLFPDGYTGVSAGQGIATVNTNTVSYPESSIPSDTWTLMETAGAVFLPCAGYRDEETIKTYNSHGDYWSSSVSTTTKANILYINDANIFSSFSDNKYYGFSVRLVRDASNGGGAIEPFELENW